MKILENLRKSRYGHLMLLVIVLLVALVGGVSAKYIHSNNGRNVIATKEFYFTSNLLKEDGAEYTLNSTADSISFTLGNNFDQLRYAQEDIHFALSVEHVTFVTGDAEPIINKTSGTLTTGSVSVDVVTLSNLSPGETYKVTAVGKTGDQNNPAEGYKQTLEATFTVSAGNSNVYKHLDTSNDAYVLLTVWTENISGDVTIAMNGTDVLSNMDGLIPDSTDTVLRSVNNYNTGEDKYTAVAVGTPIVDKDNFKNNYSSKTYRFFLDEDKAFTVDNFTVQMKDTSNQVHVAQTGTP